MITRYVSLFTQSLACAAELGRHELLDEETRDTRHRTGERGSHLWAFGGEYMGHPWEHMGLQPGHELGLESEVVTATRAMLFDCP